MTRTRTTGYVTLLSVVLVLALAAALAACGSDEPSGGTASTRGSGDAPTAPVAIEVADATVPPVLGPTSAETYKDALLAIFDATDGDYWDVSSTWAGHAPMGEWAGVTTDEDGRVVELDVNLGGAEIPPEVGHLTGLTTLKLSGVSGALPPELGNLVNLTGLYLSGNGLSGGDSAGAGQPRQPGRAWPVQQPVVRKDAARAGWTCQPHRAEPRREPA